MAGWKRNYKAGDHARTGGKSGKFGSVKSEVDGIKFDSNFEVRIYQELKNSVGTLLSKVVAHPPSIELIPYTKHVLTDGREYPYRECRYKPDFIIADMDGKEFVIDTKSFATITAEFIIKQKLLLHNCGIYLNIITSQSWKGVDTVKEIIEGKYYSALSKNKLNSL